ncbi:unnamed protein product [Staurois parvus]|uniref:Uncharacterized protein n=1 Tax=Staurois parvus TaxID=386267 RepID=A0ABN9D0S6_9NEOB|nr:unnamed protein product [Staurois parvus]
MDRIEHNGSDSDPLCSILRPNPSCGDRLLALQLTFLWSGSGVTPCGRCQPVRTAPPAPA